MGWEGGRSIIMGNSNTAWPETLSLSRHSAHTHNNANISNTAGHKRGGDLASGAIHND